MSIKVELLADVAQVMSGTDRMFSEDIVKTLADMADRPWPTFNRGKPITQVQLARILKSFGVKSRDIRIDRVAKGYYTHDVVALRDRYCSPQDAQQAQQKNKDSEIKELEGIL